MKIGLSTSVIQRGRSGVGQYVVSLVRALLPQAARAHEFTLFVLEEDLPLFAFAAGAMRIEAVAERYRPPVKNILWHQASSCHGWCGRRDSTCCMCRATGGCSGRGRARSSRRFTTWLRFDLAGKYDWARMFYGRVVARQLALRQDEIIAVSKLTACDVRTFFRVPPGQITVVPNGLDHERFRPGSPAPVRREIVESRGITAPFFLYVARLEHPAKNHSRLIAAFNRFKAATGSPWQLVFGGSDWHGARVIHELIRASPFARDIHRLGFVAAG